MAYQPPTPTRIYQALSGSALYDIIMQRVQNPVRRTRLLHMLSDGRYNEDIALSAIIIVQFLKMEVSSQNSSDEKCAKMADVLIKRLCDRDPTAKRTPAADAWLRVISSAAVLLQMLVELIDDETSNCEALVRSRRLSVLSKGFCDHYITDMHDEGLRAFCARLESESRVYEEFMAHYVQRCADKVGYTKSVADYMSLMNLQATLQAMMMTSCYVKIASRSTHHI